MATQQEIVSALLEANTALVTQVVELAREVIRGASQPALQAVPSAPPQPYIPTFDEFANQELTPAERLFYSEEEEDNEFTASIGGTKSPEELANVKEILEAAGLAPVVETT